MKFASTLSKTIHLIQLTCVATALLSTNLSSADDSQADSQTTPRQGRGSSQRYEVNQTFDGSAFFKDNNIWVYDKEFANLFGMPSSDIENLQGITAAAFRIEDTSYQQCGFGGRSNLCKKVEQCLIDLYFDESKTPLPWSTPIQSQWLPWYSSLRWLRPVKRKEKPYGMDAPDSPEGVVRNESLSTPIVAFADPLTKRQAIFTSNLSDASAGVEDVAGGSLPLVGFSHQFYRNTSVVSLQFGCMPFNRKEINIRLDSKVSGAYTVPIARFNRIVLPKNFVEKIAQMLREQSNKNAAFFKSLSQVPG